MTSTAIAGLKTRALAYHKEQEEKLAEQQRERGEQELKRLLETFYHFVKKEFELEDAPSLDRVEDGLIYFTVDELPLMFRMGTNNFRYREKIYLGFPCAKQGDGESHDMIYEEFDGLWGLGRLLTDPAPQRPCWQCQERTDNAADERRAAESAKPRPLNALEHLTLAMRQIAEEVVQERTGA